MGQEQSNSSEVPSGGGQRSRPELASRKGATEGRKRVNDPRLNDGVNDSRMHDPRANDPGVRVVQRIEETYRSKDSESVEAKQLVEQSKRLPLPKPLLPSQPEDSLTAALQGAQMINEIRVLFGNLLTTAEQAKPSFLGSRDSPNDNGHNSESTPATPDEADDREVDAQTSQSPATTVRNDDPFALHADAIDKVISECTGGVRMNEMIEEQKRLVAHLRNVGELAARLETAVTLNVESAKNTTRAMEKLDRLSMSVADVHDSLENIVATANILGASHFANDEEMRSFKDFLKHNPPRT